MSFAPGDATAEMAVETRLRRLGQLCAVPAAAALAAVAVQVWELGRAGDGGSADALASPPAATFGLVLAALFLVLLSSAVRARILRRCEDVEDAEAADAADAEGAADAMGARVVADAEGAADARDASDAVNVAAAVGVTDTVDAAAVADAMNVAHAAGEGGAPASSAGEVAARRLAAYTWATAACFAMLAVATGLGFWVALSARALLYGLAVCATSLVTMAVRWPGTGGFARAFGQEGAPAA